MASFEYGSSGDLSAYLIKKAEGSLLNNRSAVSKEPGICKYHLRNICLPLNLCMSQAVEHCCCKMPQFAVAESCFLFAMQVEFTREVEEDDKSRSLKHNKRILFQRMAPYPQRKVITFNRYTDDFEFYVNYGDLTFLNQDDLR